MYNVNMIKNKSNNLLAYRNSIFLIFLKFVLPNCSFISLNLFDYSMRHNRYTESTWKNNWHTRRHVYRNVKQFLKSTQFAGLKRKGFIVLF